MSLILISLRDYGKAMNLQQLITDFLVSRYSIQARYEAFRRFNADGQLVLLFDGFDEMAQKVDYRTTVDNFEELARAVELHSKVILTCRTPYFRTRREAEELLSCRGPEVFVEAPGSVRDRPEHLRDQTSEAWETSEVLIDLRGRPNFEIVHLLPFDREDIQAMLRARFPAGDEWERHWQQIERTYNLEELAQRPVLLDMIARSLPGLEPGQAVNAARLYEVYTDRWLVRDEEKGRTLITRDDKRLFMQELALEMQRREELSIHYSRLPERVRAHFRLEKAARGIDGRFYPWGDEFDSARCNTDESGIGATTPVGRYSPGAHPGLGGPELVEGGDSPCGCTDMAGNMWEWTASAWEPGSDRRVLRGGSFIGGARGACASFRIGGIPGGRYRVGGVRVGVASPVHL